MDEIKRGYCDCITGELIECKNGQFCLYADVSPIIAERDEWKARAENAEMKLVGVKERTEMIFEAKNKYREQRDKVIELLEKAKTYLPGWVISEIDDELSKGDQNG
jgi:uncharacterized coiled-coil DUF342 family protein